MYTNAEQYDILHVHVYSHNYVQEGDTPLLCGCWHGYQSVVECLVDAGCSLHVSNKEGETALHVAAVRGYYSIVRFLCSKGANMDAQDKVCVSACVCMCVCVCGVCLCLCVE